MSAQHDVPQPPRKTAIDQVLYIATDDMSPTLLGSDEASLWPVSLLDSDLKPEVSYYNPDDILPLELTESITEDGTDSISWRNAAWSENEESVRSWLGVILRCANHHRRPSISHIIT
jgi:hypothetical protein